MDKQIQFADNYEVVDVAKEFPRYNKRVIVITDMYHCYESVLDAMGNSWRTFEFKFPNEKITHWLRPKSQSVILTRDELEKLLGDTYNIGGLYVFNKGDGSYPDQKTYINNLLK